MSGAGAKVRTAHNTQRSLRGTSLLELLAVLTIFLILTAFIVSGFTNASRAQRLAKAADRVMSALNMAKNAAISHNAVAFLEIIDDPSGQRLKVHVFPNVADALKVTGEPAVNTLVGNSYSHTPAQVVQLAPNAWSPSKQLNYIEPASIAYQDSSPAIPITGSGQAYNNWLADTQVMELGVQATLDPPLVSTASGVLIGFNPDGTLTGSPTKIVVTDDKNLMHADQATLDNAIQNKNPHIKVIDLYGGGLVRQEL